MRQSRRFILRTTAWRLIELMNLIFPTQLQFPLYPTRPVEEDEAGISAFLEAFRAFFQHVVQQRTATNRYFDAAGFLP